MGTYGVVFDFCMYDLSYLFCNMRRIYAYDEQCVAIFLHNDRVVSAMDMQYARAGKQDP